MRNLQQVKILKTNEWEEFKTPEQPTDEKSEYTQWLFKDRFHLKTQ